MLGWLGKKLGKNIVSGIQEVTSVEDMLAKLGEIPEAIWDNYDRYPVFYTPIIYDQKGYLGVLFTFHNNINAIMVTVELPHDKRWKADGRDYTPIIIEVVPKLTYYRVSIEKVDMKYEGVGADGMVISKYSDWQVNGEKYIKFVKFAVGILKKHIRSIEYIDYGN